MPVGFWETVVDVFYIFKTFQNQMEYYFIKKIIKWACSIATSSQSRSVCVCLKQIPVFVCVCVCVFLLGRHAQEHKSEACRVTARGTTDWTERNHKGVIEEAKVWWRERKRRNQAENESVVPVAELKVTWVLISCQWKREQYQDWNMSFNESLLQGAQLAQAVNIHNIIPPSLSHSAPYLLFFMTALAHTHTQAYTHTHTVTQML